MDGRLSRSPDNEAIVLAAPTLTEQSQIAEHVALELDNNLGLVRNQAHPAIASPNLREVGDISEAFAIAWSNGSWRTEKACGKALRPLTSAIFEGAG